jgi:hypothetical protein
VEGEALHTTLAGAEGPRDPRRRAANIVTLLRNREQIIGPPQQSTQSSPKADLNLVRTTREGDQPSQKQNTAFAGRA